MRAWRLVKTCAVLVAAFLLAACAVGPDYQRPELDVGEDWKASARSNEHSGWVLAQPQDDALRQDWWTMFHDPRLDDMMNRLLADNFSLAQAYAVYEQAQASLRATQAGFFPTVGSSVSATRSGSGGGGGIGSGHDVSGFSGGGSQVQTTYSASVNASWEIDLWGRIRRSVQAQAAGLQASEADLASTRLSLQSSLAQTYFRWLAINAETELMEQTVAAYERGLQLTRNRLAVGVAAPADVEVATTQFENARVQLEGLRWQGAQLEHALAVLQGLAPSRFALANPGSEILVKDAPVIPTSLPAQLVQRRPDVAAAERRVQQANERIGVAQAAWFPDLTLSAQGGFRSGAWAEWLSAPARFWSLGPTLALTLFDAGARRAQVDEARAAHDAQAASYRQTVLTALQEVEDLLVRLDSLERETERQDAALQAARRSLAIMRNQYEAGLVDYLSVVQVETTALNAERASLSLQAERLLTTVQLIASLGGGWQGWNQPL